MSKTKIDMKQITLAEFHAVLENQGVPKPHCAFRCVRCGHIQSAASLARHMSKEEALSRAYFSCEGRYCDSAGGCDWTLGGLFQLHKLEVMVEDEVVVGLFHAQPTFEPASPEEAQALMATLEEASNE